MQWGIGGGVNWSAPRAIAFGLIPLVGLIAIIILSMLGFGAIIGGVVILSAQIVHVSMVRSWYARSGT